MLPAARPGSGARRSTSPIASSGWSTISRSTPPRWSRATASCRLGAITTIRGPTSWTSACAGCERSSASKRPSRRCDMRGTASRLKAIDVLWFTFALVNLGAMLLWPRWETIPFHLIWFSLTLLYGFRVWGLKPTYIVLTVQGIVTGLLITYDAMNGTQEWGELFEVPLMSAMFLAMVWHARRHQKAARALARNTRE